MKAVRNFNFRNSKRKITQILAPQPQQLLHQNEALFMLTMMTNKQSLFFSTFKTEDYMHQFQTEQYYQYINQQKSPSGSKQLSKRSTDVSVNIRGFNFRNSSQKIKKILITETKGMANTQQKQLPIKIHKIKKFSFKNNSQTMAKYTKNLF